MRDTEGSALFVAGADGLSIEGNVLDNSVKAIHFAGPNEGFDQNEDVTVQGIRTNSLGQTVSSPS